MREYDIDIVNDSSIDFNPDDTVPEGGKDCNKVTTAFNQGLEPYFTYDSENKVYSRMGNVTCAAAAAQSGKVVELSEFYNCYYT